MMNKQVVDLLELLDDIKDALGDTNTDLTAIKTSLGTMATDIAAIKGSQATIATNTTPAESSGE